MNITEAHAVDKVLTALDRELKRPRGWGEVLTETEQAAAQLLRARAGKALQVTPADIGRTP